MNIAKTDHNFQVSVPDEDGLIYYSVLHAPFSLYGVFMGTDGFVRLDEQVASTVSAGVENLNRHTAGGRVRFKTDSAKIAIRASMRQISRMPHFALSGCAGMDLYTDLAYAGTFMPPWDLEDTFRSCITLEDHSLREILIHLPLYSGVTELQIGLEPGSIPEAAAPYRTDKPILFYGSSITQGGCVSRPGNCYTNILSRALDADHINLGFAGNAKGEDEIADYIASLDMSCFILDYDYNAPDAEHLQKTHEPFFLKVREKHPELPIIITSRPNVRLKPFAAARREIIRETYQHALLRGDQHVFFADGQKMMSLFGADGGTVDNCHPNDLGSACIAKALEDMIREQICLV